MFGISILKKVLVLDFEWDFFLSTYCDEEQDLDDQEFKVESYLLWFGIQFCDKPCDFHFIVVKFPNTIILLVPVL